MSGPTDAGDASPPTGRFDWHPTYRGRTLDAVRAEIGQELARDQRAYRLVLEGAEKEENAALAGVLELERKWGAYDLDWAEADAPALAARIAAFELERDRRRELFPYAAYRSATGSDAPSGMRSPATTAGAVGGRMPMPIPVLVVAALVLVIVLALVLT